jgi:GT2 family glycosyltransferase
MTVSCVESIESSIIDGQYYIVIVDNCSPNNTGYILWEKYSKFNNIKVVCLDRNLGYAKGNNVGYKIAREEYKANCIIISNNDVIFNTSWNIADLSLVIKKKSDVIAPDIIGIDGLHQNPIREHLIDKKIVIYVKLIIRYIYLLYFGTKLKLGIVDKGFIEKIVSKKRNIPVDSEIERKNIVPHGSCIVFMNKFIENEEEAFDPRTFMYQEEIILAYKLNKKKYVSLYYPNLKVTHLEGISTKNTFNNLQSLIFRYKNEIDSLKIFLKIMNEE